MPVEQPVMRTALEDMARSSQVSKPSGGPASTSECRPDADMGILLFVGQEHLDRLTAVDAALLHQEGASTHMHIGALAEFEGPPPTHAELLEHIRCRLHLVPRYRQRIAAAPFGLGRQRWIDAPRFNLDYHVRHTPLPQPGSPEQLQRLAARIFSQRLDRTKPLWELWMVEGLDSDRFAVISKTHHAVVDGVAGVDLMTMLFDVDPEGR